MIGFRTFLWFFVLFVFKNTYEVQGIDCFKCTSFNSNNPACEDPFHNNYSSSLLQTPCLSGRKNRDGMFPASACIKMSGYFEDTREPMIVRDCALDSGSLTVDTELVRMSHCGGFFFDSKYVRGCVMSCSEDACNKSKKLNTYLPLELLLIILCVLVHFLIINK